LDKEAGGTWEETSTKKNSTEEVKAAGNKEPRNKEEAEIDLMFDSILLYVMCSQ